MIHKAVKALGLLGSSKGRHELKRKTMLRLRNHLMFPIARMTGGVNVFPPKVIAIEPTNRCNLKCEFCARIYWDEAENPEDDIPMELFEKIVPMLENSPKVILQIFGEPLLSKTFYKMLERVKQYDCHVTFNSNGVLLKRKNCEKLVQLGADEIAISIDGTSTFKEIRGIPVEKLIENIKTLHEVKAEYGVTKPEVSIAMVAMRKNVHETVELVDVAASLNVKNMYVAHMEAHADYLIEELLFNHVELAQTHFEIARKRAKEVGVNLVLPPLDKTEYFCHFPFDSLWVNWDGAVRPCCRAVYADTIQVGNLYETSWKDIWNGPQMKQLRRSLLTGEEMIDFCDKCSHRVLCKENLTRILPRGHAYGEAPKTETHTHAETPVNA
ncbi:MAG: radical SAM protein [candidate division Zixibacteria bacterium]|nr:radical SAM protein [candidate division Zixibacteria bacterium]